MKNAGNNLFKSLVHCCAHNKQKTSKCLKNKLHPNGLFYDKKAINALHIVKNYMCIVSPRIARIIFPRKFFMMQVTLKVYVPLPKNLQKKLYYYCKDHNSVY